MKSCPDRYELCSGQAFNFHKSTISFGRNTHVVVRSGLAKFFNVSDVEGFGKYLSLPSITGHNRHEVFSYIKDKMRNRLGS